MAFKRKDVTIETIKFSCKAVIYTNETGFKIIAGKAYTSDKGEKIGKCSIKGFLFDVSEGDELFAAGIWEDHPKYGRSFSINSYVKAMPNNAKSMLTYLKQGNIKCINEKKAELIVKRFGDDTFDVLLYQTWMLKEIKGIGEKSIEKIQDSAVEKLKEQQMLSHIISYIQNFHISPAYANRIYSHYGLNSIEVLNSNPYKLAEDISGIGFLKADEIALSNGIAKDNPLRIESAVLYVLKQMNDDGDVFGYTDDIIKQSEEFLGVDSKLIEKAISNLIKRRKIHEEADAIYLNSLFRAESDTASLINTLIDSDKTKCFEVTEDEIKEFENKIKIEYAEEQKSAIKCAGMSNVMILTGGPGTGKSTVINGVIAMYKKRHLKVLCAAPTGRASKRMSEVTGMQATTIHKLLDVKSSNGDGFSFRKNSKNPLSGDVLIIDESSMIDMPLAYSLMQAVPQTMKVIFVGDIDQLPSVGYGNVLNELINSSVMPVIRLQVIFRQGKQSDIIKNAHLINNGLCPSFKNNKDSDFFFMDTGDMDQETIRDKIVEYVCEKLPKYYKKSIDDIQVLAPMNKGATGVYELNDFIQNSINKPSADKPVIPCNGHLLRLYDKVMYTRNDYDRQVFNGDIGKIVEIHLNNEEDDDKNNCFVVDFDGNAVKFDIRSANNFVLAYAISIHKSQGSEFPIVVVPFTMANYIMLQRNLLYTGVTRAKQAFILFGQKKAVIQAVKTLKVVKRNTRLAERLRGVRYD